ncbi:MAG TPA: ATP-dependent RecD-like DNA helicase [Firmicutes bacterium]|nr:ATP-dependent RecD-like DNA helicase [Bacillota bacterium]
MEITGVVERTTFQNEENGFTVAKLTRTDSKDETELITIVGYLSGVKSGETLRLYGDWIDHPAYGRQFSVDYFETVAPVTKEGVEKYLGSGLIKGIGPATARKIVETFGLDTLDLIERQPERLQEVPGIGPHKARRIIEALAETKKMRQVMLFLRGAGVTTGLAGKIYRFFGNDTIRVLQKNPYLLAQRVPGIGFKTADRIAGLLGRTDPAAPERIRAGLLYLLGKHSEAGHVFAGLPEFAEEAATELGIESTRLQAEMERMSRDKQVVLDENRLYLPALYHSERGAAKKLTALYKHLQSKITSYASQTELTEMSGARFDVTSGPPQELKTGINYSKVTDEVQERITLSPEQKAALALAQHEGVLVITGGPGTGKTTLIRSLIRLYQEQGLKVVLAAPTGRAAKRLTEATGLPAKTIHRLLEFGFTVGEAGYGRDEKNPLEAEAVIIDEVSMVDLPLFYHLLKAIPLGARLILVGDEDQLPSVGPGTVLRDIIASRVIPQVKLKTIFRQARESQIVTNAHLINVGRFPKVNKAKDFFFIPAAEPEQIVDEIVRLVTVRLPRYLNCDPVEEIQVLSPMRRTVTGVDNLNHLLQKVLNPESSGKPQIHYGGRIFRLGDKVMQIRNNYQKMVFNGDMGRITKLDPEEQQIEVSFSEQEEDRILYEYDELDELVLSYAVTVHKSQGSEYPVVILPVTTQHFLLLQRNLFYTAVTRAKKMAVLVGMEKALAMAVKNNKIEQRNSRLAQLICEYGEGGPWRPDSTLDSGTHVSS